MAIAPLGRHELIIGRGWLKKYGALLNAATDELIFREGHCSHPGARSRAAGTEESSPPKKEEATPKSIFQRPKEKETLLNVVPEEKPKANQSAPEPEKKTKKRKKSKKKKPLPLPEEKPVLVRQMGAAAYRLLMHKKENECFSISIKEVNKALGIGQISANEPEKNNTEKSVSDVKALKAKVPKEYYNLLDVFSAREANKLPPHRPYDY